MSKERDTIQIMQDAFLPEQLSELIECLEADGHRCSVFKSINKIQHALASPRTKLLVLSASPADSDRVIEAVKANPQSAPRIPIVVYFRPIVTGDTANLLAPEIEDFILDPFNPQEVRLRIQRLLWQLGQGQSDQEVEQVRAKLLTHFGMRQLIGQSPAFLESFRKILRVAPCDASVLLLGDTGTGKEMCARAIHYLSPRADKPFIPINCGSIPPDLFENEMFGHEREAFTDARNTRRGLIAEAEGGTIFLDEVDTLSPSAQVKLLRFLQDRQYKPLGSTTYRHSNTRTLAASNQNLLDKVRDRTFREDLYYRLKVVSLHLPPLRERKEDIMPLAMHFLKTSGSEYKRPGLRFSNDAMQEMLAYDWPGNVRELENMVCHAVVMVNGSVIRASDLRPLSGLQAAPPTTAKVPFKLAKARVIETFEKVYLSELIAACGGNISWAAREAQKDRRAFFALLKKHGLISNYQSQLSKPQS
jgi:DNA-binding NtrC family response regulator